MQVKVAAVSPRCYRGASERDNVARALAAIDEAADQGAQIVCFPEGYPGPYNGRDSYSSLEPLSTKARERGVHVVAGMVERSGDQLPKAIYYLALKLIGPGGDLIGTYRRVLPNPKEMNEFLMGGKIIAPGDELPVFETTCGRIGLLVCSEVWSPELPLILALQGAEIIFAPIGGALYELYDNWRCVLRTRAAENNLYVVACQNIWGMEDGLTMIAGPDEVLAETTRPGVLVETLDLDRVAWLRQHTQELTLPKPYKTIPGLLRHRRPELYGRIVEPQPDAYDFRYYVERREPAGRDGRPARTTRR